MGMRSEEMERWGATSIFKESARLLHKHYRLFLPFFLAFYLPFSIARVFEIVFLSSSSTPLLDTDVVTNTVNTVETTNPTGDQSFTMTMIISWTLFFLTYVVEILGTGAVSYITAYLYTPTDIDDDRSIIPKVVKFLPHTFLRVFITKIWTVLAFLLLPLLSGIIAGIIAGILNAIVVATAGWSNPNLPIVLALFLTLAGAIYLAIVFALAQVIAVLEPGNYGREALKRSTRLARIGRVWTIVAVALVLSIVLSTVLMVPVQGIETSDMPVWAKVVLLIVIKGLDSVIRVYFGVVWVVMYFVYKARFDAAGSAGISMFKQIDSAEHSYDPIVEEKISATHIS